MSGRWRAVAAGLLAVVLVVLGAGDALASFVPTDLTGLNLWVDAGTLSLSDGALVGTWADQSPSGNDLTAFGSSNAQYWPEYRTSVVNGLPVVRFGEGTNPRQRLTIPTGTIPGPDATVFLVLQNTTPTSGALVADLGGPTYLDWTSGWGTVTKSGAAVNYMNGPVLPNADFGLNTILLDQASSFIKLNGALDLHATNDGRADGDPAFTFGGTAMVGGDTGYDQNKTIRADIAEIVIYNRALTSGEEEQVGFYLADKYGLSTSYIPEPATAGLLVLGALGFALRRRRG